MFYTTHIKDSINYKPNNADKLTIYLPNCECLTIALNLLNMKFITSRGFNPLETGYGYCGDAMNTIPTGEGYWSTLAEGFEFSG